jgi:chromosome segregation ATPase
MPDTKNNLFLFEAIELRAELDARLKTLEALLPEARENRDRFAFRRDDAERVRPVASFDVAECRAEIAALEGKKRKLNNAIQRANFERRITVASEEMSLSEALDLRKSINQRIGELTSQLREAAYERIVYKEERDIVEPPDRDFGEVRQTLDERRRLFRDLNRRLRAVAFEVIVEFKDEP